MMGDGLGYSAMGYHANGVFWVLLIVLIVWLYSVLFSKKRTPDTIQKDSDHTNSSFRTPVEILEKRLAEGKIDIDEFNRRLAHMNKGHEKKDLNKN